MTTPAELESRHTLRTAVARYEELRTRDSLTDLADADSPQVAGAERLSQAEVLEMLALGEVIAHKTGYGRQLSVRTARATGASWSAIGQALGTTKQAAWEAHARWIEDQATQHRASGSEGLDDVSVERARRLAGGPDDEPAG
jgi:hypothetical protein